MKEVKLCNTDCSCRIYHSCLFACKPLAYHDPIFVHSSSLLFYAKIEFDPITPIAVYIYTHTKRSVDRKPARDTSYQAEFLAGCIIFWRPLSILLTLFLPNNRVSPRSYSGSRPVLTLCVEYHVCRLTPNRVGNYKKETRLRYKNVFLI